MQRTHHKAPLFQIMVDWILAILIFCSASTAKERIFSNSGTSLGLSMSATVRKQVRQFERTVISFQNTRKVQIHPQPCSRFDTETCAYWLYSKSDANNRIHCQHMLSSIHYCYGKVTIVMLIVLRKWIIKQTPSSPTIWKLITLPIDVTLARVSSSTSWCTADQ